jgi:hypothetical protein
VASDPQVELPACDLVRVDVGEQDVFTFPGRTGEDLAERADDAAATGADDDFGRLRERVGNVIGETALPKEGLTACRRVVVPNVLEGKDAAPAMPARHMGSA